jgi:hypothetical protein
MQRDSSRRGNSRAFKKETKMRMMKPLLRSDSSQTLTPKRELSRALGAT